MKKTIMILAASAFVLGMTSCKKDYTCTCTVDTAGITATASTTINDTKKNAEEACEAGNSSTTLAGITTSTTCTLD